MNYNNIIIQKSIHKGLKHMNKEKIIKNYWKYLFWKSYYNSKMPKLYIVIYTIHNNKNNTIRNIVKKVLENNGYICLYSKLNIKNIDYNLRYISLANYEELCNFEKKRLLSYIAMELSNNIDNKYLVECLKQIEFDIIII